MKKILITFIFLNLSSISLFANQPVIKIELKNKGTGLYEIDFEVRNELIKKLQKSKIKYNKIKSITADGFALLYITGLKNSNKKIFLKNLKKELKKIEMTFNANIKIISINLLEKNEAIPDIKIVQEEKLMVMLKSSRLKKLNISKNSVVSYLADRLKKEKFSKKDLDILKKINISKGNTIIKLNEVADFKIVNEPNYIIREYYKKK